jgi:hypothetical protein
MVTVNFWGGPLDGQLMELIWPMWHVRWPVPPPPYLAGMDWPAGEPEDVIYEREPGTLRYRFVRPY